MTVFNPAPDAYRDALGKYIEIYFKPLIEKEIYSLIISRDHQIEAATNYSIESLGFKEWEQFKKVSLKDFENTETLQQIFGDKFMPHHQSLVYYAKKIHYLQQLVFKQAKVIQFIDMLPYNGRFVIYLTNYLPVIHQDGTVIAIHSTSVESYILRFQGHLRKPNIQQEKKEFKKQFSNRELEILFLLTNGANQDQIAQILNIARTTVSTIIAQICPKFNIAGANTKLLMDAAINQGFYLDMPKSLWKPCIIILNEELLEDQMLKETQERK